MIFGEDALTGAVLLGYQNTDAFGTVTKHAEVLQMLNYEKDAMKRYPGKVMDPNVGRIDDVQFQATNDLNTPAEMYDGGLLWHDIHIAIAIKPLPEPGSLVMFALGLFAMHRFVKPKKRFNHRTSILIPIGVGTIQLDKRGKILGEKVKIGVAASMESYHRTSILI